MEMKEIISYLLENYTQKVKPPITVTEGLEWNEYTLADLFIRRYLNDGDDAPNWGLTNVKDVYAFCCENKEGLIQHDMVNESAQNNFGFSLWNHYKFEG